MSTNVHSEYQMRQHGFLIMEPDDMVLQGVHVEDMPQDWLDDAGCPTKWPKGYYIWRLDHPEGPLPTLSDALCSAMNVDPDVPLTAESRIAIESLLADLERGYQAAPSQPAKDPEAYRAAIDDLRDLVKFFEVAADYMPELRAPSSEAQDLSA